MTYNLGQTYFARMT